MEFASGIQTWGLGQCQRWHTLRIGMIRQAKPDGPFAFCAQSVFPRPVSVFLKPDRWGGFVGGKSTPSRDQSNSIKLRRGLCLTNVRQDFYPKEAQGKMILQWHGTVRPPSIE